MENTKPIRAVQQIMLGTVTESEKQAEKTLAAIKDAGYEGIELNRFMIHPTPLLVRFLTRAAGMPTGNGGKLDWHALIRNAGLCVPALHTDLGSLEKDPEGAAEEAHSFETSHLVITGMYRFAYGDPDAVKQLAERLNRAGERLQKEGISLCYHNHNCELQRVAPGKRAYDLLIDGTDPVYVGFEFDSYWIAEGGADPKEWMDRLGERLKLWHINDRGARLQGPAMTPILKTDACELGTGNMPLDALKERAERAGVRAIVLETHKNWIDNDPIKSIQVSARYFKENS